MPLSYLDIGLIVVMLISGLLAMMRGFTREVLSIASWAAAAGAALFAYLRFRDAVRAEIQPNYLADGVLIAGVFLVVLVIVSFITARISDAILDSRIGALDRTLGFAFGAARGLIIVVIGFMFFSWLVSDPNAQPQWVREARSRPLLVSTGDVIRRYLPEDPEAALQRFRRNREGGDAPADRPPSGAPQAPAPSQRTDAPATTPADRQRLDSLIRNSAQPPAR
jgi:membrane protein required for colicin V production